MGNSFAMHKWTKAERRELEHLLAQGIIKTFGEIYTPLTDGDYRGIEVIIESPLEADIAIWQLCQAAKHKLWLKVFGKIKYYSGSERVGLIILGNVVDTAKSWEKYDN